MPDTSERTARALWTLAVATLVILFAGEIAQMWVAHRDHVNGLPTRQEEERRQDDLKNLQRATTVATAPE